MDSLTRSILPENNSNQYVISDHSKLVILLYFSLSIPCSSSMVGGLCSKFRLSLVLSTA